MKHVVVCKGAPDRFRVFCDWRRRYVLDNASETEVTNYFLTIAAERTLTAVADLIASARVEGVPVTH